MKRVLFLIAVLVCSLELYAYEYNSDFTKGNNFYQKKEYEKAITAYKNILESGYQGASVYFNLGNCYFRQGKLGYAILNYEKAAKLSPGDDEIVHNLKIANFRTIDKVQPIPSFFLFRYWDKLVLAFSVSGWTIASFVIYLLLLASVAVYFVSHITKYQRLSFITGFFTIVFFCFSVFMLWQRVNYQQDKSKGIIVAATSVAKLAPDNQSKDSFVIHEGIKVKIEDRVNEWVKIKLMDGKTGWVNGTNIETI